MISIVVVNWNSDDFITLMLESLFLYTKFFFHPYELIVVDNSTNPKRYDGCKHIINNANLGHGEGLNIGSREASGDYVMFLDADCHFINRGWEDAFLTLMKTVDVVGGKGVPVKPIRPACMFMKAHIAKKYDWRASPGYKGHRVTPDGTDVAIAAYRQMIQDEVPIQLIESQKNRYGTLNGEEWCIDGVPYIYHHWHGAHLAERQVDFPNNDLQEDKALLFRSVFWRRP